jgi:hypothetical protein
MYKPMNTNGLPDSQTSQPQEYVVSPPTDIEAHISRSDHVHALLGIVGRTILGGGAALSTFIFTGNVMHFQVAPELSAAAGLLAATYGPAFLRNGYRRLLHVTITPGVDGAPTQVEVRTGDDNSQPLE